MTTSKAAPPQAVGRVWARPTVRKAVGLVAGAIGTVLAATFVIYCALSLAPGDPVAQRLGARSTDEQRAVLRAELGLDDPLPVRYWHWLTHALQGDFGQSLTYRQDVAALLAPRLVTTATLVLMSAVIILIFGIALGALGGSSQSWRPVISGLIGVGVAIPGFVAASVLISVFAVQLRWFPTFGAGSGFADRIWHLTLPAVALSLAWTAYIAQMTLTAVKAEVNKEHVMTARGRGLSRASIFRRHVLRNSAIPVLTASGLTVAGLVAGSVVVEAAFGIDGIGTLLVAAVSGKDYAVATAVSAVIVVVFVLVTTIIDLAQLALDPRLREVGKS